MGDLPPPTVFEDAIEETDDGQTLYLPVVQGPLQTQHLPQYAQQVLHQQQQQQQQQQQYLAHGGRHLTTMPGTPALPQSLPPLDDNPGIIINTGHMLPEDIKILQTLGTSTFVTQQPPSASHSTPSAGADSATRRNAGKGRKPSLQQPQQAQPQQHSEQPAAQSSQHHQQHQQQQQQQQPQQQQQAVRAVATKTADPDQPKQAHAAGAAQASAEAASSAAPAAQESVFAAEVVDLSEPTRPLPPPRSSLADQDFDSKDRSEDAKLSFFAAIGIIDVQSAADIRKARRKEFEEKVKFFKPKVHLQKRKKMGRGRAARKPREFVISTETTHDDACEICRQGGVLLMCDTCPKVYHLGCLTPPLSEVPDGSWLCPPCQALRDDPNFELSAPPPFDLEQVKQKYIEFSTWRSQAVILENIKKTRIHARLEELQTQEADLEKRKSTLTTQLVVRREENENVQNKVNALRNALARLRELTSF